MFLPHDRAEPDQRKFLFQSMLEAAGKARGTVSEILVWKLNVMAFPA
jgi:hypothetical protein